MRIKDLGFSTLLSAGVLLVGLTAIVLKTPQSIGYLGEPLIGRNASEVQSWPFGNYAKLRKLDPKSLDERERVAKLKQELESIAAVKTRQEWRGVLFYDKSATQGGVETLKSQFRQDAGFEEGIPCHFLVTEAGEIEATERWSKQRRCLAKGLKEPEKWIVVFSLKAQPQPLFEAMLWAPWSQGFWAEAKANGDLSEVPKSPFAKDD